MRKRIGVYMGEISATYAQIVLTVIYDRAKELDYDVFVLASYGSYGNNIMYTQGEMSSVELPVFDELDGIIVCDDTFDVFGMDTLLEKRLKKEAKCPVVYLRAGREGFYNVVVDNKAAMESITRHFIYDHGFRDICFMKGKAEAPDAKERYQGFLNVMNEAGIEVTEHMVFGGNFWRDKGKEAVDWFMEGRTTYPQAIICSNDYMAFSICEELTRRGVFMPEQVCVSGYDNLEEARRNVPSLTTINVPFANMAVRAVDMIDNLINGRKQQKEEKVQTELVFGRSCGCGGQEIYREGALAHKNYLMHTYMQRIVFMTTELQGVYEEEEYLRIAEEYAKNINYEKMFLCLCDEESRKQSETYSEQMILKRIFSKDAATVKCEKKFSRGRLLPDEICVSDEPQMYMFISIHHKSKCYGYLGVKYEKNDWPNAFLQAYAVALANVIEDAALHLEVLGLEEIRKIYLLDSLTGIYNRRGYENKLKELYEKMSEDGGYLSIVSIDMDGLKYINDNFGHTEGDDALKRLAKVMKALANDGEVCARIGGDEFVMLLKSDSVNRHLEFADLFNRAIEEENARVEKPYPFGASYGICCISEEKELPLMACIQMADRRMYIQKNNRKTAKALLTAFAKK